MSVQTEFLLTLFTENDIARSLPAEHLKRERAWASGWLFAHDTSVEIILTDIDVPIKAKRDVIAKKVDALQHSRTFIETFLDLERERNRVLNEATGNQQQASAQIAPTSQGNTVSNSNLDANGNIIVGNNNSVEVNYHINAENKPEIRCPQCKTVAPQELVDEAEKTGPTFGLDCANCGKRIYPVANLAGNVSLYANLTPQKSDDFNHMIPALENDLKQGRSRRAYDKAEELKVKYGREGVMYEICAITYFYATPIDHIIHESARTILVYLEDAQRYSPNSESYDGIAMTIASSYANRIKTHLHLKRMEIPTRRVSNNPKPSKEETAALDKLYRDDVTNYRSDLLRSLDEFETAYRIYPLPEFLKYGVYELCGQNGTPWFDLKFESLFSSPPNVNVEGYVWDYYDLLSNMTRYDGTRNNIPEELLAKWRKILHQVDPGFKTPEILIGGEVSANADTVKSKLVSNAYMFWAAVIGVFLLGLFIGNTYTVLFSLAMLVPIAMKFGEVKQKISNLLNA